MTHSVTWNKDKSVLSYRDDDGVWLKEVFNKNLTLIKRTTSWGEWVEHEYVQKGKAKDRISSIRKSDGTYQTFKYDDMGRLMSKKK